MVEGVTEVGDVVKTGGWNNKLVFQINGVSVASSVKIIPLKAEKIIDVPTIVMKDRTGSLVRSVSIDAATGKVIGEGIEAGYSKFNRVMMNERDEVVSKEDIVYFKVKKDGSLEETVKFQRNIGSEAELILSDPLPESEANKYLIENTYEVSGKDDTSSRQLFMLAKQLKEDDAVGVIDNVTLTTSFKQYAGLVFPIINSKDDKFSLLLKLTQTMIEPIKPMAIPHGEAPVVRVAAARSIIQRGKDKEVPVKQHTRGGK